MTSINILIILLELFSLNRIISHNKIHRVLFCRLKIHIVRHEKIADSSRRSRFSTTASRFTSLGNAARPSTMKPNPSLPWRRVVPTLRTRLARLHHASAGKSSSRRSGSCPVNSPKTPTPSLAAQLSDRTPPHQ
jgi:hypothetical protein